MDPTALAHRPQFWGIETTAPFYVLAAAATLVFAYGVGKHVAAWVRAGWRPSLPTLDAVTGHAVVRGDPAAGLMHALILWGFAGLFVGTTLSALDHWVVGFLRGPVYIAFAVACDVAGLSLLVGLTWAIARRLRGVARLEGGAGSWGPLLWLVAAAGTGFAVEGLRVAGVEAAYAPVWWLHTLICLGGIAALPWTRLFHVFAAPAALALTDEPTSARAPVWLDACTHCGRCVEVCPPTLAGEPFSARGFLLDGTTELAWHCTTCGACAEACPLDIATWEVALEARRGAIEEGTQVPSGIAEALQRVQRYDNPWASSKRARGKLAKELAPPGGDTIVFAGCTAAVDTRAQDVVRALSGVLDRAEVGWSTLGKKEPCCGDIARECGEDGLREDKEERARDRLDGAVVAASPHCLQGLRAAGVEAWHYTETLADLVQDGRLALRGEATRATYHDPCTLARHNGVVDEPRQILRAIEGLELVEMPRHGTGALCCGGGGGRMWNEEPDSTATERISELRIREAAATGADLLVTACPRCLVMLEDARRSAGLEGALQVIDLAELVVKRTCGLPQREVEA